jgi:hypothetical protein
MEARKPLERLDFAVMVGITSIPVLSLHDHDLQLLN